MRVVELNVELRSRIYTLIGDVAETFKVSIDDFIMGEKANEFG